MSSVSFVEIQNNTRADIKQAILQSIDLIGFPLSADPRKVVIKPNLCYYLDYTTGQTTDPHFIGSLIDAVREKLGPETEISIVESDASAMKCKYAFKMLGYEKLSADYDVPLVNLSEDKFTKTEIQINTHLFEIMIPDTIKNADLSINVPKIKYMGEKVKLTCALKNIYGCNPYPKKYKLHVKLDEAIVALNKAMPFDLCIIDGNIVSGIQPKLLGLVMASADSVAIDAAAARVAGINPHSIKYLRLAHKEGLGNMDFSSKGLPLAYFGKQYPRRTTKTKLVGKAFTIVTQLGLGKRLGLE